MTYQPSSTDIDAIISAIENEARNSVSHAGPPKITKNTSDVILRNFTYQIPNPLVKPVSINHTSVDNDTSMDEMAKFPIQTQTTTSTFTFSFTEGFKFGTKSTLKVGIPDVGEGSEQISFELDFSATQTTTKTEEQSWTYDEPFPVPKRSKVCAQLIIDQNSYDPDFSGEVVLTGEIEASASTIKNHSSKSAKTVVTVPGWLYHNKANYPAIKFEEFQDFHGESWPTKAIITVGGKFTGVSGSNLHIKQDEIKLGDDCPSMLPTADSLS